MKHTLTLLAALLVTPLATAVEFHVSPTGNDGNPGTDAKPFATLERARQAVRSAPKDGPRSVIVRGGTYAFVRSFELGKEDSGVETHPVVWQAARNEEVRFSGGVMLPANALVPIADEGTLERLDPSARRRVLRADLGALGIKAINQLPTRFRGAPPVSELFFNDQRMSIARWPNEGSATCRPSAFIAGTSGGCASPTCRCGPQPPTCVTRWSSTMWKIWRLRDSTPPSGRAARRC